MVQSSSKGPFPILYVEDEEDDIVLMQQAFKKAGVVNPLKTVIDGEKAIDYLAGAGSFADRDAYPLPGLILLDLNLPRKSGFDVLQWIRQNPQLRFSVVVYSSSGDPEDIRRSYEFGAHGYVRKPNNFQKLTALAEAIRDFWCQQNVIPAD